jgi:hypothetical protein
LGVDRYHITEAPWSADQAPAAELSILAGVDSSSYLIIDHDSRALVTRILDHDAGADWWTSMADLSLSYRKVRIAALARRFTLVPTRLYDAEQRRGYLASITSLESSDVVLADSLPELEVMLVYAIPQDMLSTWRRAFIGSRFYHALSPIIQQLAQQTRQAAATQVYGYIRRNRFAVIALERGQLRFANTFPCRASKDYLYYLLLAYEQCQWDPQEVGLQLFGEILPDGAIYPLLQRYFKKIRFQEASRQIRWGEASQAYPSHLFTDLACLHLHH